MGPETPQAEYELLYKQIDESDMSDKWKGQTLWLLHRLRPRGTKLTVAARARRADGKLLCCTRKVDKDLLVDQRRVCLPGGHVDPEDFAQPHASGTTNYGFELSEAVMRAAKREFVEETGLNGWQESILFAAFDECGHHCTLVSVEFESGEPVPEPETSCIWLTVDELLKRAAFPLWYRAAWKAGKL